jgi:hypothetical protein
MIRKYKSCPDSLFFLFIKRSKKNKNKNKNTPKTFLPTKISDNSGCSMTRIEAISNTKKNKPIKMACIGLVFLKKMAIILSFLYICNVNIFIMIANNIFRAISGFFTNVAFKPLDAIRFMDNWWLQNTLSWILAIIAMAAFVYWMRQLKKFKGEGTE